MTINMSILQSRTSTVSLQKQMYQSNNIKLNHLQTQGKRITLNPFSHSQLYSMRLIPIKRGSTQVESTSSSKRGKIQMRSQNLQRGLLPNLKQIKFQTLKPMLLRRNYLITKKRPVRMLKNHKQSNRHKCSTTQPLRANIRKDRQRKSNKSTKP